ncbi:MAG TPA: D-alanyl-D-alanine carboxypeptidase family protein [Clostridia bacterium]|nr:D-alanyl-D-alanine carboxypeptidase family protein [Clostridia bacterium]
MKFGRTLKVVFLMVALVLVVFVNSGVAFAEDEKQKASLETSALSAIMVEASTGKVLFEKEPTKRLPMASVTKIMTSLLTIEALERGEVKLGDTVVTSEYAASMGGSQVFLEPGEEMTMKEMLLGVMVGSANDSAVAVAEHVAGSEQVFIDMMNSRAAELGMKDTHFSNPTGLPVENHYTTAHDLSLLMGEVINHDLYKEFATIKEYDLRGGDFKLWNLNKLLWWYEGVDFGKTGWTNEAAYCLASSAERDGLRLIVAVLGVPETRGHFRESIRIYNYGFARYKSVNIADKNALIENIPVEKGMSDSVDIVTADKVSAVVEKGGEKDISSEKVYTKRLTAPVEKGQKVGEYIVFSKEKEVQKINLVASESVEKASVPHEMYKVMDRVYRLP